MEQLEFWFGRSFFYKGTLLLGQNFKLFRSWYWWQFSTWETQLHKYHWADLEHLFSQRMANSHIHGSVWDFVSFTNIKTKQLKQIFFYSRSMWFPKGSCWVLRWAFFKIRQAHETALDETLSCQFIKKRWSKEEKNPEITWSRALGIQGDCDRWSRRMRLLSQQPRQVLCPPWQNCALYMDFLLSCWPSVARIPWKEIWDNYLPFSFSSPINPSDAVSTGTRCPPEYPTAFPWLQLTGGKETVLVFGYTHKQWSQHFLERVELRAQSHIPPHFGTIRHKVL